MLASRKVTMLTVIVTLSLGLALAQFRERGRRGFWGDDSAGPMIRTEGGMLVNEDTVRTARETPGHSSNTPNWSNEPGFEKDVFTFTRIIFKSTPGRPGHYGWINDYPDSDLNLSYRLQQLTSLKVNPDGRVMKLTDPALFDAPLIHMAKPGRMILREEEAAALRQYLLAGGTLMADDFWGADEWDNFEAQMQKVLPGRAWVELPMEHPVFHCVFDLNVPKNKLQVPYLRAGLSSLDPRSPNYGNTAQFAGEDMKEMHVRAWLDDRQHLMIITTHNTNNGDGWEREAEDEGYFREYSENRAYPLGINIIFYVMTH
jgi:hypothetical protein